MSTIFLNKNKLHPKKHFTKSSRLQTSYAPNTKTIQKPPGTTDCMTHFLFLSSVAFRAKCKMFSRHLQKPILKTEKGRFKGL